jgi:hypothetical protein
MKTTLTTSKATHILLEDTYASWSKAGALALVMYLEELENDTETEVEFCHVELRCDWTEYESLQEFAAEHFAYDYEAKPEEFEDAMIRDFIEENTTLIEFQGGILVQAF